MTQEARFLLVEGKDPAVFKKKDGEIVFDDVVKSFLEIKKKEWSSKHYKDTINRINNYLYSFKDRNITTISKQDIINVLKNIKNIRLPNDTKKAIKQNWI